MDFPKSVPNVGLVDGRFVDESNVTGQVGSLITADWGNAMTSEIINVIEAAELVPTEGQNDQLVGAIEKLVMDGLPDIATEEKAGIAKFATQAQVDGGNDNTSAVTPLKLAVNQVATGAISFARRFANFRDVKPLGTSGGTYTAGAWRTRDLNTVVANNIPGATLTSNQLTLPAGTYFVIGQSALGNISNARLRFYSVTDSVPLLEGIGNGAVGTANLTNSLAHIMGSFTLSAPKTVELQLLAAASLNTYGFGYALSLGSNETYSDMTVWQLFQ